MKPRVTTKIRRAEDVLPRGAVRSAWLSGPYRTGVALGLTILLITGLPSRTLGAHGQGGSTTDFIATPSQNVTIAISTLTDDAEEQGTNGADPGATYLDSTDLELVADQEAPPFGNQTIGLRFNGLTVPPGATITTAYITFAAVAADPPNRNDGATNLSIAGQATGNPTTFTSARNDLSSRPRTNATVSWTPSVWTTGTNYNTPNLAAVVQEIIQRGDWASGNSIAFFIAGSGSRSASSYDGNAGRAPTLYVEWGTTARQSTYLPLVQNRESGNNPLLNGDFEAGQGVGWQEHSAHGLPIVVQGYVALAIPVHGGAWGAWLAGTDNELSWIEQTVSIPAGNPALRYWHYILSEDSCGHDRMRILIDGVEVERFDLCQSANTGGWVQRQVDLTGYAGSTVQLQLRGETNANELSHLLVDDIELLQTE